LAPRIVAFQPYAQKNAATKPRAVPVPKAINQLNLRHESRFETGLQLGFI
jgi:hypothetical protein